MAIGLFPDHSLGPARRRHQRSRVAHDDSDAVLIGGLQRETPRGPEMESVTHRDEAGAEAPRAFDGNLDRLVAGEMAERVMRVENNRCAFVRDDLARLFQRDRSFPDPVKVHFDQHHAVRGLTLEIGIDQSPRDGYRRRVRDAGRNEEPRH